MNNQGSFASAIIAEQSKVEKVRTTNGAKAYSKTGDAVLDYFSKIGARRLQDNTDLFLKAFQENEDLAIRALLWTRDIRGGAGERQSFRDILKYLAVTHYKVAQRILAKVPELGRWDDLLVLHDTPVWGDCLGLIQKGLEEGNQLCAKWMPRKGKVAESIRAYLGYPPKRYRKTLVTLTNVVEQKMCNNEWDAIDFNHVPSCAGRIYRDAFSRNTDNYQKWLNKLTKGEEGTKVNASVLYPHEIVKDFMDSAIYGRLDNIKNLSAFQLANAQWEALPNFVPENSSVLPVIDVSGSMFCSAGGSKSTQCVDVAVGLGLYLAMKNTGAFKNLFLNFHSKPSIYKVNGSSLSDALDSINWRDWGGSTNLEAAFGLILEFAKKYKVSEEDMPKTLIIFSDMQFDRAVQKDTTLLKNMKRKYKKVGYKIPRVVFWNLANTGNTPAKFDSDGAALVSGFSPSLMWAVLNNGIEKFTPENLMLEVLSSSRYDY